MTVTETPSLIEVFAKNGEIVGASFEVEYESSGEKSVFFAKVPFDPALNISSTEAVILSSAMEVIGASELARIRVNMEQRLLVDLKFKGSETLINNMPERARIEKRGNALIAAQDMVLKQQIASNMDTLSDEQKAKITYLFDAWSGDSVEYTTDLPNIVEFDGIPYRIIQNHTSQADWTPAAATSLFTPLRQTQGAAPDEWVAPTGAHDAYQTGDRVTFEGTIYESLIDANTHSPSAYPAGWQVVE